MSLCEIFIQEYESKCDSLRCELESSEWVFKKSLIGSLTFLEEGNEAVETLLGKAKARYPDSAVLWKYIEREYQLIPFLQSALGLKSLFKHNCFAAGVYQRMGCYMWTIDQHIAIKSFIHANRILNECRGGVIYSYFIDAERDNSVKKKQSAIKGGIARAELYTPVKEEVIKLLYKHVPSGKGWKNRTMASKAIESDLLAFIKGQQKLQEGLVLSEEELVTTIQRWGRSDKDVRAAFEATVRISVIKE